MTYTYKQINDTYVVLLASANRHMLLQEPAFRVLEDWAHPLPQRQIICNCALECRLNLNWARRFVKEATRQLQSLIIHHKEDLVVLSSGEVASLYSKAWFSTKYYLIHGRQFCFQYGDAELEGLIHPGIGYLEYSPVEGDGEYTFDLCCRGDQLVLQTGGQTS